MPSPRDQFETEAARQAGNLNRLQKDTLAEVVRLLKQAQQEIQDKLQGQPGDYQLWHLPQLNKAIEKTLLELAHDSGSTVADGQAQAYASGQQLIDAPVKALAIDLGAIVPKLSTHQLLAMQAFTIGKMKDVAMDAVNRIQSELGLTVIGSQDLETTLRRIQDILGGTSRKRATAIVRTELGRAYGVAAQARAEQAQAHVPGMKKQWRRSGKIHSRRNHDLTDGQIRPVDKPFILGTGAVIDGQEGGGVRMMHPHDPKGPVSEVVNCGCVMLPYLDKWKEQGLLENPGKKPFTPQEIALNPLKSDLHHLGDAPTMQEVLQDRETRKLADPAFIRKARTVAKAEQAALTLGVKSANYAQSLDIGNDVNKALDMLKKRGLPVPEHVHVNAGLFAKWQQQLGVPTDEPSALSVSKATGETYLIINPNDPYWSNLQIVADYQYEQGVWSTNHKFHAVIHESGHAAHYQSAPTLYASLKGTALTEDETIIAAKVSKYATDDPLEFVAETFSILATGGKVPADVVSLYTSLGGPIP